MMRVLLAGEGKTELGEWIKKPPFREPLGEKGVLVALIERVADHAFTLVDGLPWTRIRKYRSGYHASAEERNVLGLALQARRTRCDAVVFSRDRDGSVQRQHHLDEGIRRARELFSDLKVVGGIAIENIEGWIVVLLGAPGARLSSSKTKPELEVRFGIISLQAKVDVVASARLDNLLPGSLTEWLGRARDAFARTIRLSTMRLGVETRPLELKRGDRDKIEEGNALMADANSRICTNSLRKHRYRVTTAVRPA